MLISELTQRVIDETGRPDLEDFILAVVTSSIKQIHSSAKFVRDMVEETIIIPSPSATIRLTLPPRFREFQDVAIVDKYGVPISKADHVNPSAFLDTFGKLPMRPTYYVMGNSYTVMNNRDRLPIQYLYVTYFQHPPLDNTGQSTWVLEQYPEMVVNYCNFKVHGKTGNDTKSNEAYRLYIEALNTMMADQEVI